MPFLNEPCPFYSSTLDAIPRSLKASPILSLKILIILKAQLKCHLFSKIDLNPKSKLIILFLAPTSTWFLCQVCHSGLYLALIINCPPIPTDHSVRRYVLVICLGHSY